MYGIEISTQFKREGKKGQVFSAPSSVLKCLWTHQLPNRRSYSSSHLHLPPCMAVGVGPTHCREFGTETSTLPSERDSPLGFHFYQPSSPYAQLVYAKDDFPSLHIFWFNPFASVITLDSECCCPELTELLMWPALLFPLYSPELIALV